MNIALITIMDDSNLGNRLQNYAVQEILKLKGHNVTTLYFSFKYYSLFSKYGMYGVFHDFLLKTGIRSSNIYLKHIKKDKKLIRGLDFTQKYINTSKKYIYKFKYHKMDKYKNDFDKWCVGSDQIWNEGIVKNNLELFLDFAERQNTFSFSASFGNIDIKDEYIKTYKMGLNHLGAVSVREESGRHFVNNLTERDVTLLLDPTLYLPQEKWKSISKRPESVSTYKKYVLIYFLGGMSDEQRNIIENFANINNCIIVDAEDYNIKIGPNQFIWLIDHAEFIFTDSFHGCAFSIIFRKKFVAFNRKNYSFDMSDRITTLLDTFSISDQFINTDMYSFDTVNNIINKINDKKIIEMNHIAEEQYVRLNDFLNQALGN